MPRVARAAPPTVPAMQHHPLAHAVVRAATQAPHELPETLLWVSTAGWRRRRWRRVRTWLSASQWSLYLTCARLVRIHVARVGMMGSGKTTVGGILSSKLEYMCFDTDSVIEQATGRAVSEIFSEEGEDAFRALETDVLKQLAPLTRTVICTGGGAVMRVENWGCMTHGISVWIDPPVASLARRVAAQGSDSRPLASDGGVLETVEDIEERLEALREERESQYKQVRALHRICRCGLSRVKGLCCAC